MIRSIVVSALAALLAMSFAALDPAGADDAPALPDPIMTPGSIDAGATVEVVCNGTTRERRHVSTAEKAAVLAAYNIPAAQGAFYEIDHLIPLAIGGANVVANLWPQPWAEADEKDVLEVELQRRVCHGLLGQAEAQREIADDWVAAYRRYVRGALVAVAPIPAPAPLPTKPGFTVRLKAEVRRLSRLWIFGSD